MATELQEFLTYLARALSTEDYDTIDAHYTAFARQGSDAVQDQTITALLKRLDMTESELIAYLQQ